MGVKKLVKLTVEVEIEIELPENLANPTPEDIEGINYCGFDVKSSNDVYKEAGRLILWGYTNCNNDVFGVFHHPWRKSDLKNAERECFYDIQDIYVDEFSVENIEQKKDET
ncbi:hypothetical protein E0H80_10645 [Acinetobacter sp. ANC 4779]|uniref:hypothetical protein n=1 Tax=Acinetobacter sp. ANC 4779 TaxID=2529848 RepID=UPI00103A886F|nr:hypothetical protein [Acinetobacter sp. ANC 4779]TCB49863.1 hypothetical protein E0H80_10645 [Acinetobacter sp. ANC 4779]